MTDRVLAVHSAAPVRPSHHGHRSAARWPLRTGLDLGPLPGAVPCARAHTRQVLWEWRHSELSDDAGLVVSELVTNAIEAAGHLPPDHRASSVHLWLASDSERVLVLIGDASHRPPMYVDAGPDGDRGRGLHLVSALANRWGWYPVRLARTAKVVWAEWCLPSMAVQGPAADQPGRCGGAR
jgi:hypothetical protein